MPGRPRTMRKGTDFHATADGHVSITPLKVDLTDHEQLRHWATRSLARLGACGAGQGAECPVRLTPTASARARWTLPAPRPRACAMRPGGIGLDSEAVRSRMVQQLVAQGVADPRVLAAMRPVERHRFVDSALVNQAYEDTSLPIGLGQTISKPNVVARMIELLLGGTKDASGRLGRVLEIGTGCGYQAAVLSRGGYRGLQHRAPARPAREGARQSAAVPPCQRASSVRRRNGRLMPRARRTRASSRRPAARLCRRRGSNSWQWAGASSHPCKCPAASRRCS